MSYMFIGTDGTMHDLSCYIVDSDFTFHPKSEDESERLLTNYETAMSFTLEMPKKESRRAFRNLQRLMRRPSLIHNGGKP